MFSNLFLVFIFQSISCGFVYNELYEPPTLAPRVSWLARPPSCPLPNNSQPAQEVIVLHTGGEECDTPGECVKRVVDVQTFQQDALGLADISFNFLIGGDGVVYVGRGWYKEGEHPTQLNHGTIIVAFVGNFANHYISDRQLDAFVKLMNMGMNLNLLSPEYNLVGQCQPMASISSGQGLMEVLRDIFHFDHSLPNHCAD